MKTRLAILLVLASAAGLFADYKSKLAPNPAYEKIKALAGSWKGSAMEGGKNIPTSARFKVASDGSVVAGWLNEGTTDEMVTMFHLDGNDLIATHYCAAHNQPRMVLEKGSDPNKLIFKFKDGTNIKPGDGYMHKLVITLEGSDRHSEDWTFLMGEKETTAHFDFKRE